jgi:surface antigen
VLTQPANLRSSVTLVRCFQHGCRIGLPVLLGLVTAGCQSVESDTGISEQQQVGFVGGALVAAAAGASAPWLVGGALIGAGLGTGIATLGNQGQAQGPPNGESFDDFLANPPGAARTWRNPANDDHGTVTIAAETRAADGTLCKQLSERMWLTGSGEQEVDATACQQRGGSWQITDIEPQTALRRDSRRLDAAWRRELKRSREPALTP